MKGKTDLIWALRNDANKKMGCKGDAAKRLLRVVRRVFLRSNARAPASARSARPAEFVLVLPVLSMRRPGGDETHSVARISEMNSR